MPNPASKEKQLEWKGLIEQQRQSGLSVKKWCRQNQIRFSAFYYWQDKLFPTAQNNTLDRREFLMLLEGIEPKKNPLKVFVRKMSD